MLTLSENWLAAIEKSGIKPIWLVSLELAKFSDSSAATFQFVSGDRPYSTPTEHIQNSLANVTNLSSQIDAKTRDVTISDCTLTFSDDGAIREIIDSYYIAGKKVTVWIGTPELASTSDFVRLGVFYVSDITADGSSIDLICQDTGKILAEREIVGSWIGYHPLEVIEQILQAAAIDPSSYDYSTLNAEDLNVGRHWMTTRALTTGPRGFDGPPRNQITDKTNAKDLIYELVATTGGTFAPNIDGVYKFAEYDSTAAAVVTWTENEIADFEQVSTWENMINRVTLKSSTEYKARGASRFRVTVQDTNAQSDFSPNNEPRVRAEEIETAWLNGYGSIVGAQQASGGDIHRILYTSGPDKITTGDYIYIGAGHENGMAGTFLSGRGSSGAGGPLRSTGTGASPQADRTISASRLLILCVFGYGAPSEIIAFDQIDEFYTDSRLKQELDPNFVLPTGSTATDIFSDHIYVTKNFRARISSRGYFGTTQNNWKTLRPQGLADDGSIIPAQENALCWDITHANEWTTRILSRFAKGAPQVRVSTDLSQYAVQLGDFVKLNIDRFIDHGRGLNQTTQNAVWEVTGKEVRITEDTPAIIWDLVWVRDDTTIVPYTPQVVYKATLAHTDASLEILTDNLGEIMTQNDEGAALTVSGADPYPTS